MTDTYPTGPSYPPAAPRPPLVPGEVVRESPPPQTFGRTGASPMRDRWGATMDVLRQDPGEWYRLLIHDYEPALSNVATWFRKQPGFKVAIRKRRETKDWGLWAVYEPPEEAKEA